MPQIQIWAIVVATVASQILGFVWYSVVFGRTWAVGYRLEADALASTPPLAYVGTLLGAFLFSLSVAVAAGLTGVHGPVGGILLGVGLWAGIVLPRFLLHALFARIAAASVAIDLAFDLLVAIVTGLIVGVWPA
jgi:hypothetical protein